VYLKSGQPISALRRAGPPPYRLLQIGLTLPRELLYARVDERVERMMADGLLEEVRELIARGYGPEIPAMSGLGYRQIARHLSGRINLGEAVEQIKHQTHRFVRRQYAWFRLDDPAIHWFDLSVAGYPEIRRLVSEFLA
jgi:tRNA dimethylallyltransferase